jgi:hypothetical protein
MRRTLWILITFAMGCSGNDMTRPAEPAPVASVTVQGSNFLHVGDSLSLNVTLRDAAGNVLANRAITFTSSDESVATVNGRGVVNAMTAGSVTISASSEGKKGEIRLETTAPEGCAFGPWEIGPWEICALYMLVAVDDQPLPVKSPFGTGNWDYDADAGTWQLISETLTFRVDGSFTDAATEKAASGAMSNRTFVGTYTSTASELQLSAYGLRYSAIISGTRLTTALPGGRTFAFERR